MALRYDTCRLDRVEETASGIRVQANLTRSGIFVYKNADGSERREYRPPEEVFKTDSMRTFAGVPVTLGHPGLVTPDNWQTVAVGHTCEEVKQDGQMMAGTLIINRADAIAAVKGGNAKEVSMGYQVDIDPTPGSCDTGRYDCIQRNIRGNHAALIPPGTGRAGSDVCLRLDSNGDETFNYTLPVTITPEQLAAETTRANTEKSRADAAEGKVATLDARVKELENPARFDAAVEARVAICTKAREVLGDVYKSVGKTNRQVKADVVAKLSPTLRLDDKVSDDFVEAAYQTAVALAGMQPHPSHANVRVDANTLPVNPLDTAFDKNRQASVNAWRSTGNRTSLLGK